jgi:hypothetical protein
VNVWLVGFAGFFILGNWELGDLVGNKIDRSHWD